MGKLSDVNSKDIRDAIRLGCRTMSAVFNSDDPHRAPFFDTSARPEACLKFNHVFSDAHVPGRHLNALLNARKAIGVEIAEEVVQTHARAAFLSYSGPVALPLNREEIGGPPVNFTPHNIREGFHALTALVTYDDSAQARELAEASIDAILEYWDSEQGWDRQRFEQHGIAYVPIPVLDTFTGGLARAIGPLVKYYRATYYGPALDLALALKEKALRECFDEAGTYREDVFGPHTHSVTCTMSSLAQLAEMTADAHLMERVKAFYDNGLWWIRDALGWVLEMSYPQADPDRGECNNSGDIVETALILARWGYPEYYADAERIVRGHLLPSQLRDTSFIVDPSNPGGKDGKREVADRHRGAFGFPAPYGHEPLGATGIQFNMDIVGGAVASLVEVYRETTRVDAAGHWVNLLFDNETEAITVESPYTHPDLRVTVKRPGPLWVRVPPWAGVPRIVGLAAQEATRYVDPYLFIARPPLNAPLALEFPLADQELILDHRTRQIRVRLRGDEVVAMENFGADLTFFDPIH